MSQQEFVFSLDVSDGKGLEAMVSELARTVLGAAGYTGDPSGVLSRAIESAFAAAGGSTRCVVRFQAHDGKMRIAVSCDGHPRWQTAVALPPS